MELIRAEIKRYAHEALTYYPDFIVNIITAALLFFIMAQINTQTSTTELTAYIFWVLCTSVLSEASVSISAEKQLGTFRNLLIKPASIIAILSARTVSWFLLNLIKIVLIVSILFFFYPHSFLLRPMVFPVLLISAAGVYGFALILAALTLLYTKTASFESIISYVLLLISGTFFEAPDFFAYSNHLSMGITSVKLIARGTFSAWYFFLLAGESIVCIAIGIIVFMLAAKNSDKISMSY